MRFSPQNLLRNPTPLLRPLRHRLGDAHFRQRPQVRLAHLAHPPVPHEVGAELLVLDRQVLAAQVGHEEVGDQHADDAADGGDDEGPALAQVGLDGREDLGADGGARLAQRGRDAVARPAHRGGVALGRDEAEHVAGAEVARGLHEAVEDDEERDDGGDLVVRAADDQAEDQVAREADHHDVAPAQPVAEVGAAEDAGEGERAQEQLPLARGLDDGASGARLVHDAGDDVPAEHAVGEGDEVVEEPGAARADQGFPVVPQDQAVGHVALDGAPAVELGVEHLNAEVEHRQGPDHADAEAHAPDRAEVQGGGAPGRGEDDEEDADGEGPAEGEGEVGDEDEDGPALGEGVLVGRFGRGRTRGGIFSAGPEADDAAGDCCVWEQR